MDGFKISTGQSLLETGQTLKQIQDIRRDSSVEAPSNKFTSASFGDTLKSAIASVNRLQKEADVKMQELATGRAKSLPDVMIAAERADIAFKLMVQVRNKIIEAYQEIMKMQV